MTLGQGQEMTLTFNTHIFSLTQLVSGHILSKFLRNPLFSIFPTEKPKLQNLTLPKSRSRSLNGHHLNKQGWTGVPDATHQVSLKSAHWFREEDF